MIKHLKQLFIKKNREPFQDEDREYQKMIDAFLGASKTSEP